MIRHGLRWLVKQGDPEALRLLGYDHGAAVTITGLTVTPDDVPIGGHATIAFTLTADTAVRAVVDYAVHHVGARGQRAPKVFKLTTVTLHPGTPKPITRRHRFRDVSARRLHPGPHRIDIQVTARSSPAPRSPSPPQGSAEPARRELRYAGRCPRKNCSAVASCG